MTAQITTPPESVIEGLKSAMELMDILTEKLPEDGEDSKFTQGSADFLRELFPHLDDLTLAAFAAYVATNLGAVWVSPNGEQVSLGHIAVTFAHLTKTLAWSLNTPEAKGA